MAQSHRRAETMPQAITSKTKIEAMMTSRYFRMGVEDVKAGRQFDPFYDDTMSPIEQWLYERGRQFASTLH